MPRSGPIKQQARIIYEAAAKGLEPAAALVSKKAKKYAPVRNIFSDTHYNIRFKSMKEIDMERDLRARLGLGPDAKAGKGKARTRYDPMNPGQMYWNVTGARIPRRWSERRATRSKELLEMYDEEMAARKLARYFKRQREPQKTVLSARGAFEVRSERAMFTTWGHRHIGGRLRGEIFPTKAVVKTKRAEAWVISPTSYAKYMEFGTRHAAAHPFLRPALNESHDEIVGLIEAAAASGSRTSGVIEIVVRI